MHVRLAQGPKPRRTAGQAKFVIKRKDNLESTRGQPGRDRVAPLAHPRTPARLRVGGLGMAADLQMLSLIHI